MTLLLLQMAIVILVSLLCGAIAQRLGQTRVIGEMIGGILLGPSVLGRLAPHLSLTLFPSASLGSFEILSNIGLVLFLFLIGSELDLDHLVHQRSTAVLSSLMSMALPFGLALVIAPAFRSHFAPADTNPFAFSLFLGIALSITAFPVLARILEERGLATTQLGATALMCAAVDDVAAWSLLAVALAMLHPSSSAMPITHRMLWLAAYLFVMIAGVRPLGRALSERLVLREPSTAPSRIAFALILAAILISAAATDAIGVHPLFGAFLAGVCLPRIPSWQATLRARLDTVVSSLLLPLFFALTGMRTRLDLLAGPRIWLWTIAVLLLAVAGKMGGAFLAARLTGQPTRYALALGALLNTRGLVELVVLNIAYQAHVFSATLFTMLVVMALITTMMTTPLLHLLGIESDLKAAAASSSARAA
jgi:Kef-type K+ transport system membrane component KefB